MSDPAINNPEMLPALMGEIGYARMLASRLERLSVDSYWAHRTSGLRGSLLRALDQVETPARPTDRLQAEIDLLRLKGLVDQGADLLAKAAREIRGS